MTPKVDPARIPAIPHLGLEELLWQAGNRYIAGIDEAGRGALAGPVAVAAVILPPRTSIAQELRGVRDSKQMTPAQRAYWRLAIREAAADFGVGLACAQEIDALGILPATRLAAARAVAALSIVPEHLLLDYLPLPDLPIPQTSLPKGDRISLSIAAASVLAKTGRDAILSELHEQYPAYGFARHKGYGSAAHCAAIAQLGPSPVHRLSFAPCKAWESRRMVDG